MKIVSPLLKEVLYPSISKAGIFHRMAADGLAVVTYHGVVPEGYASIDPTLDGNLVTAVQLRRQLRLLKAHYNVISPELFVQWRKGESMLPRRAVLLTCDDGLLNCLTDMLPVLKEENLSCLFFVTGASAAETRATLWYEELLVLLLQAVNGHIEISAGNVTFEGEVSSREQRRAVWWNWVKRLSQLDGVARNLFLQAARKQLGHGESPSVDQASASFCRRFGLLTVSELRELASAGMAIGAHTLSHPVLSQLAADVAFSEISESRAKLEFALGMPVWAFAYPFGDLASVTPQILEMPQTAGFISAFLNYGGGLGAALPSFAMPRVHVTATMNLGEFEAQVCGFYSWLRRIARRDSVAPVQAQ